MDETFAKKHTLRNMNAVILPLTLKRTKKEGKKKENVMR